MVAGGWRVVASGFFGQTQNFQSYDVISSAGIMSSSFVWFVLADAYSNRQFLFYRDSKFAAAGNFSGLYVAYSAQSGFNTGIAGVGGNPVGPATPPAAYDSVWLNNSPDRGSSNTSSVADTERFDLPTVGSADYLWLQDSPANWSMHIVQDEEVPFTWALMFRNDDARKMQGFLALDCLHNTGNYDTDASVCWCAPGGLTSNKQVFTHSGIVKAWYLLPSILDRHQLATGLHFSAFRFLPTAPLAYQSFTDLIRTEYEMVVPGGLPLNPFNDTFMDMPLYYSRGAVCVDPATAYQGFMDMCPMFKGKSSIFRLVSFKHPEWNRISLNDITSKNWLVVGQDSQLCLAWDGTALV
jgi:hypothetical protein